MIEAFLSGLVGEKPCRSTATQIGIVVETLDVGLIHVGHADGLASEFDLVLLVLLNQHDMLVRDMRMRFTIHRLEMPISRLINGDRLHPNPRILDMKVLGDQPHHTEELC